VVSETIVGGKISKVRMKWVCLINGIDSMINSISSILVNKESGIAIDLNRAGNAAKSKDESK
jgi:hypothetical protein